MLSFDFTDFTLNRNIENIVMLYLEMTMVTKGL